MPEAPGDAAMKLCGYDVGLDRPFFLIAGPCVVESRQLQVDVAGELKGICADLEIPFVFKSSYDKANRSSAASFRGPGMEEGLRILADVRRHVAVPVLTDVHAENEIAAAASVVDVLQTPAFRTSASASACSSRSSSTRATRPGSMLRTAPSSIRERRIRWSR